MLYNGDTGELIWLKKPQKGWYVVTKKHDFVEVVRCKDCKHKTENESTDGYYCEKLWIDFLEEDGMEDIDFCSYGERRT